MGHIAARPANLMGCSSVEQERFRCEIGHLPLAESLLQIGYESDRWPVLQMKKATPGLRERRFGFEDVN
jgi:hypothetical protein